MSQYRFPLVAAILSYAANLRFRPLFFITASLFILDLLIPDLVPFANELMLGLLTLLFGSWKKRTQPHETAYATELAQDTGTQQRDSGSQAERSLH